MHYLSRGRARTRLRSKVVINIGRLTISAHLDERACTRRPVTRRCSRGSRRSRRRSGLASGKGRNEISIILGVPRGRGRLHTMGVPSIGRLEQIISQ